MHVCHLTSVHPLSDSRIFHKECRTLAAYGFEVTLVGPGEGRGAIDGVQLVGVLRRGRGRIERMFWYIWHIGLIALRTKARICHFHDPELILVGPLFKVLGRRVVYDVHENLPKQVMAKSYIPVYVRGIAALLAAAAEKFAGWYCDAIVATAPSIAERFPENKTVLVRNFPIVNEFRAISDNPYRERPFDVAYVGGLWSERGLHEMLQAISMVSAPTLPRLVLAGRFADSKEEQRYRNTPEWARVAFLGWQDRAGVGSVLARARAGLVTLHPTPNHVVVYPVKMFEYMAAGLPVIASDFPLWREIIEESRCGLLVNPVSPAAIAEAIQWLFEHPDDAEAMGKRGQAAVMEKYSWETEAYQLYSLYRRLSAHR